jgi:hypothetical protein
MTQKLTNFFIVGCVRSGTTLLRNILREHPKLACPEETHFFRWSWPFRTQRFRFHNTKAKLLKKHREIDGITDEDIEEMMESSSGRGEFMRKYMKKFMEKKNPEKSIWFDKSPQNIYGILLIRAEFPGSRFIHIIRNPLNVVASLKKGLVMKVTDLVAASNYWRESVMISQQFSTAFPAEILHIHFEDLTEKPEETLAMICDYIGVDYNFTCKTISSIKQVQNRYLDYLSEDEQDLVRNICSPLIKDTSPIRKYF